MSSQQYVYQISSTQISLGATPILFQCPKYVNGFKLKAGASMVIVNGITGATLADGYLVNNDLEIQGPASFYLAAGGAETAEVLFYKSSNDDLPTS